MLRARLVCEVLDLPVAGPVVAGRLVRLRCHHRFFYLRLGGDRSGRALLRENALKPQVAVTVEAWAKPSHFGRALKGQVVALQNSRDSQRTIAIGPLKRLAMRMLAVASDACRSMLDPVDSWL